MSALPKVLLIFIIGCWLSNGTSGRVNRQWTKTFTTYGSDGRKLISNFGNSNWGDDSGFLHSAPQYGGINTADNNNNFPSGLTDSTENIFYYFPKVISTRDDIDAILPSGLHQSTDGFLKPLPQFNYMNWMHSNEIFPSGQQSDNEFSQYVPQFGSADSNEGFNSAESSQSSSGFSQFEQECLNEHNKLRAKHSAPPLRLSRNLNNYAQEWANYLANNGAFHHRSSRVYGENLFLSYGGQVDGRTAVRDWYNEIRMYKYGQGFSKNTGHFTQVVWKGSKELGCAFARRGNSVYVVANYSPSGNVQGQFSSNVLPPKN